MAIERGASDTKRGLNMHADQVDDDLAAADADFEGIGYALRDLARLYQGEQVAPRVDSRMDFALEALRGAQLVPDGPVSGMPLQSTLAIRTLYVRTISLSGQSNWAPITML